MKVQAGKFPNINKGAGWNKAVQAGIQQSLLLEKPKNPANFQKLIKRAGWNKTIQAGFFQKNNKMCCTFIRQTGVVCLNFSTLAFQHSSLFCSQFSLKFHN